ncbi:MAG: hypothetical protein ACHREM_06610 [Polyangiales bacterium]
MKPIAFKDLVENETSEIDLKSITGEFEEPTGRGDRQLTIEALIRVRCVVTVPPRLKHHSCGVCGAALGPPDVKDDDVLLYMLAYHDGNRLMFPQAEDERSGRDSYPVRWWMRSTIRIDDEDSGMRCPDCVKAMNEALVGRRRAVKKTKEKT